MKNTFDISRFGKFFCMELRLFRNIIFVLIGLTLVDIVFSMANHSTTITMVEATMDMIDEEEFPAMAMRGFEEISRGVNPFRTGGAFGILLFLLPFFLYGFVYHPTKSLTYTMLPASWLEKFASAWVMCVIFIPILTFGISLLAAVLGDLTAGAQINYHSLNFKEFMKSHYLPTIAIQSFFFWAVFWFKRKKVQKTVLVIVLLLVAFVSVMFPHSNSEAWSVFVSNPDPTLLYCVGYGLMVLLWTAALLKYPRTQI